MNKIIIHAKGISMLEAISYVYPLLLAPDLEQSANHIDDITVASRQNEKSRTYYVTKGMENNESKDR